MARQGSRNQTLLSLKKRSNYRGAMLHSVAYIDSIVRPKSDGLRRGCLGVGWIGFVHFLHCFQGTLALRRTLNSFTHLFPPAQTDATPKCQSSAAPFMDPAEGGRSSICVVSGLAALVDVSAVHPLGAVGEKGGPKNGNGTVGVSLLRPTSTQCGLVKANQPKLRFLVGS